MARVEPRYRVIAQDSKKMQGEEVVAAAGAEYLDAQRLAYQKFDNLPDAALLPGIILGVAAMWLPQYFPKWERR